MRSLIALLMLSPAFAQTAADLEAVVATDLGTFRFEFAPDKAPSTAWWRTGSFRAAIRG